MKSFAIVFISLIFCCCNSTNTHQSNSGTTPGNIKTEDSIIASGAVPELVSNQFSFTEGPAADKNGDLFFTDQPNNKIWKYGTDDKLSVFVNESNRSNGLYFDVNGNLLACADESNQLISFTPSGEKSVLVNDISDSLLNGPNDLWISPGGNIYFTDPLYERSYWSEKKQHIKGEYVYLLAKGKTVPVVIANDLVKPNGIIGTPDGKQLYVADIGDNKTYIYNIDKNGLLTNKTLFTEQGSDGMTIDNKGNIYLTGNGVTVYNKSGKKIQQIAIPQPWTANVCFGGAGKNLLFITASTSVYTLRMNVTAAN
ncbi:SMP-30/gluconolactonase/LRE family protein [soil metagenome]